MKRIDEHVRVVVLSADPDVGLSYQDIPKGDIYTMGQYVLGAWVEKIMTPIGTTPEDEVLVGAQGLTQGVFMMVDENGNLNNLLPNKAASAFYPQQIVGDVVFINVKQVFTDEGPDWEAINMPASFYTNFMEIALKSFEVIQERIQMYQAQRSQTE